MPNAIEQKERENFSSLATVSLAFVAVAAICGAILLCSTGWAGVVPVRYREGSTHGFLELRTLGGKRLAAGDEMQLVRGDRVITELLFRFTDGSLYHETSVFSQRKTFRLLSDHLVEKGPIFPHPIDQMIDAVSGRVTVKSTKKGHEKTVTKQLHLPPDTANGLVDTLLKNVDSDAPETLSYVATTSKPRVVTLVVSSHGKEPFFASGWRFRAIHYVIKVHIGGISGAVAPLVGKKPPDTNIWILGGKVPAFLRFQGTLYDGGPIWQVDLAAPVWPPKASARSETEH